MSGKRTGEVFNRVIGLLLMPHLLRNLHLFVPLSPQQLLHKCRGHQKYLDNRRNQHHNQHHNQHLLRNYHLLRNRGVRWELRQQKRCMIVGPKNKKTNGIVTENLVVHNQMA
jgi:hypothetical protein